jgi:acetyltransferase-like isoleucine patch superfamily enzyme
MKKTIEQIIRLRNPNFAFDKSLTSVMLLSFTSQQLWAVLRGFQVCIYLRKSKMMLRGKHVSLNNIENIQWGKFLKLGDYVYLNGLGKQKLLFGNNVSIGAFSRIIISTSLNNIGNHITIGNNVGIGEFAYLGGAGGLTIGDDCIVGQYLSCHPENHVFDNGSVLIRQQGITRKGISIGKNCWIGSKVTILDGVQIGDGCVIAAGAVVTKSFPPNSVIGGVPAKILAQRNKQSVNQLKKAIA